MMNQEMKDRTRVTSRTPCWYADAATILVGLVLQITSMVLSAILCAG
jgi:hypothetical protein